MPYKDKNAQKKAVREAVQRHRKGITSGGITEQGITQYPPIIHALADPVKRVKLEKIYESLKTFRQEKNVYLGCGKYSMPFDMVGEYLEATRR